MNKTPRPKPSRGPSTEPTLQTVRTWPHSMLRLTALLVLMAFAIAACGGGDDNSSDPANPAPEPASVDGGDDTGVSTGPDPSDEEPVEAGGAAFIPSDYDLAPDDVVTINGDTTVIERSTDEETSTTLFGASLSALPDWPDSEGPLYPGATIVATQEKRNLVDGSTELWMRLETGDSHDAVVAFYDDVYGSTALTYSSTPARLRTYLKNFDSGDAISIQVSDGNAYPAIDLDGNRIDLRFNAA